MNIIISALHFPWQDIDDCLSIVKDDLRLDGVELSCATSFNRPHCTRQDLSALPSLKAATGLSIEAHIWEDLAQMGQEAGSRALLHWLEMCQQTEIEGLVIHGGSYPDRREGIVRTKVILDTVIGRFERAGVVLKLENHYAYDYRDCHELFSEPWEFLELFSAIQSPALRFCFDTGHGHMTGNWEALLRELAPYLQHVHLADNHGVHDDHCPYRQGTVPWDAMFTVLQDIGFDGTFCVEYPVRDDRTPFYRCVEDLAGYRTTLEK